MTANDLDYIVRELNAKKQVAPNGQPMWFARDLMEILAYTEWRNFKNVIDKAIEAANNAGMFSNDHFVEATGEMEGGKGARVQREDVILSRRACYLVAMNADPSKPEVATAQTYFTVQTQRQEAQDQLTDEERRLLLRDRVKDGNKKLGEAASVAGVTTKMFGIFHDAGYKGLYGGIGRDGIKKLKSIPADEQILDCMGRAELAANEFRITQTEEKLRKEKIKGEQTAIDTHFAVGAKVRQTIKEIGGTMPEKLPPEPSIKKLAAKKNREDKKALKSGVTDESR